MPEWRIAFLAAGLAVACTGPRRAEPLERFEFSRAAMGTEFRVLLYASDAARAEQAATAALERVAALDRALSDYDPCSELSLFGAASDGGPMLQGVALSEELFHVLAQGQEIARASEGAFDVTVGRLTRLWRRARRLGEAPDAVRLADARFAVGHGKLVLDTRARRGRLLAQGMRLDLGGIAKGYALDEALRVLREYGIECALVDGGGDVAAGAPPPGRRGWRVALVGLDERDPGRARLGGWLLLAHGAVATSGDLERGFELDGRRYSHVLDPRTGSPFAEGRLASVLAPTGLQADAWATALCVLEPDAGLALLARGPGLEGRVTHAHAGRLELHQSEGFASALFSDAHTAGPASNPAPDKTASETETKSP